MKWLEQNKILVDEQNGFRQKRSCLEHIYSLYTIINNRKLSRQSTYAGFVDFRKAFDMVQRDFLWYKLMKTGINGRILEAIQSLYANVQSTVKVNHLFSPWFLVSNGVRQGCKISPTLFSVYISNLAQEINGLNCGINVDDNMVSTLLYADDIIFIAPTAENLQKMFDKLNIWSRKLRLTVNLKKTKVIHFRTSAVHQNAFRFKCGEKDIENVSSYKYLGLWFNEHLNMTKTVTELAKSASRALSALYSKVPACWRNDTKWAPSSEFVSSSIPSWQILTAFIWKRLDIWTATQPFRGARDLAFCLKVPLDSLLIWASSEGSGETARMRRLAWTFAARIGDKYQIRLSRSKCFSETARIISRTRPLLQLWRMGSIRL